MNLNRYHRPKRKTSQRQELSPLFCIEKASGSHALMLAYVNDKQENGFSFSENTNGAAPTFNMLLRKAEDNQHGEAYADSQGGRNGLPTPCKMANLQVPKDGQEVPPVNGLRVTLHLSQQPGNFCHSDSLPRDSPASQSPHQLPSCLGRAISSDHGVKLASRRKLVRCIPTEPQDRLRALEDEILQAFESWTVDSGDHHFVVMLLVRYQALGQTLMQESVSLNDSLTAFRSTFHVEARPGHSPRTSERAALKPALEDRVVDAVQPLEEIDLVNAPIQEVMKRLKIMQQHKKAGVDANTNAHAHAHSETKMKMKAKRKLREKRSRGKQMRRTKEKRKVRTSESIFWDSIKDSMTTTPLSRKMIEEFNHVIETIGDPGPNPPLCLNMYAINRLTAIAKLAASSQMYPIHAQWKRPLQKLKASTKIESQSRDYPEIAEARPKDQCALTPPEIQYLLQLPEDALAREAQKLIKLLIQSGTSEQQCVVPAKHLKASENEEMRLRRQLADRTATLTTLWERIRAKACSDREIEETKGKTEIPIQLTEIQERLRAPQELFLGPETPSQPSWMPTPYFPGVPDSTANSTANSIVNSTTNSTTNSTQPPTPILQNCPEPALPALPIAALAFATLEPEPQPQPEPEPEPERKQELVRFASTIGSAQEPQPRANRRTYQPARRTYRQTAAQQREGLANTNINQTQRLSDILWQCLA